MTLLRKWENKQLVTVPCSDEDAIIDFVFIPFIVEEEEGNDRDPVEEGKDDNTDKTLSTADAVIHTIDEL